MHRVLKRLGAVGCITSADQLIGVGAMCRQMQACHCDDLITDSTARSKGYGKALIGGLKVLAAQEVRSDHTSRVGTGCRVSTSVLD